MALTRTGWQSTAQHHAPQSPSFAGHGGIISAINTAFHAAEALVETFIAQLFDAPSQNHAADIADHTADRHRDGFITPIHQLCHPGGGPPIPAGRCGTLAQTNAVTSYGCSALQMRKHQRTRQPRFHHPLGVHLPPPQALRVLVAGRSYS